MGSLSSPKLPAGPTHAHHPAAAEPPKAWPGCPSPSPSQTLHMQVEETGLQWVLDPSSTLFPKRDSSHGQLSAACGQGSRAGHAQRARRLRAGLPRSGMRRERSACGRGSWTEHAHGLLPDSAIRAGEGRAARSSTRESALHVREVPEKGGSATNAHAHTPAPAASLSEGLAAPASPTQPPTSPLSCPSGPVQAQGLILAPSKRSPGAPG